MDSAAGSATLVADVVASAARSGRVAKLVAVRARNHGNVLLLPQGVALADRAVTDVASDLRVEVLAVAERDKTGQRINPRPRNRLPAVLHSRQLLDLRLFL